MLLVLSSAKDKVAQRVTAELTRRDASFAVINPSLECITPSLQCALSRRGSKLRVAGRTLALDDIESVWLWRPELELGEATRAAARLGDAAAASYVEYEWSAVVYDALQARPRRWLPGVPSVIHRADGKLRQLQLAERLGLRVPDSLVTNDIDEALAFLEDHGGDVIAKPPSPMLALALLPKRMVAYTRALKPRDLVNITALGVAPVLLQQRIPKRVELRVTVVGGRVFPAEIHSQATRRTRVDWRQYDHAHTTMRQHTLPASVRDQCLALVRELGLSYGAIDLILTPGGDYVFLEINPNGQWLWIEDAVGFPITSALCDELLGAVKP